VIDGHEMTNSDVAEREAGQPAAASGLRVHILTAGSVYDLEKRQASIPE
jgi:hypothetical protein